MRPLTYHVAVSLDGYIADSDGSFDAFPQSGDPIGLVRQLKAESSTTGIWLCGGGALAGELREEIDRLVLKVNPVLLGSGIRLFRSVSSRSRQFILESNRAFDSGVLMATYHSARN